MKNQSKNRAGEVSEISIRTNMRPGDLGTVVKLHGVLYAREHGFNHTFEPYVAAPMSSFVLNRSEKDRIWIAETQTGIQGCIATVKVSESEAQLRWFLVRPEFRNFGLGKRLAENAVEFCREKGYDSIFLWTLNILPAAAHIYRTLGFEKTDEKPGLVWGVELVEEKYCLNFPVRG